MSDNTAFEAVTPWYSSEAMKLRNTARYLMNDHGPHDDQLARDNCGACALGRFDYAGWLRVYVEAGLPVPRDRFVEELERARTENELYYRAILRDIVTFGITVH